MRHCVRSEGTVSYIQLAAFLSLVSCAKLSAQTTSTKVDFERLQATIDKLLPTIRPAVVCIESGGGSGSGVIVSADGLVLTAAHVIDKAQDLTIVYPDGRRFKGKSLGTFGPADAGMAQITQGSAHPFVNVASGKDLEMDQTVLALGHPGGFDEQRGTPLRIGHILAIGEHFIQTDTALIGGDSGGPTFDLNGDVIGIHSHISEQLHVNNDGHIASFHLAWDSMREGEHDKVHYGKSLGDKEKKESRGKLENEPSNEDAQRSANRADAPGSPLRALAEKSKANGGSLKLSREELLKLRQDLSARTESLAPTGGMRMLDNWARHWHSRFQADAVRRSVYKLIAGGRTVALATAVHPDGVLVTKASEIKGKEVSVDLGPNDLGDQALHPAKILAVSEELDLAILHVVGVKLRPLDWTGTSARLKSTSEMGTICVAVGASEQPVGFGVISVAQRPLDGKSGAYLGVTVEPEDGQIRITDIKPNSPAVRAGLKTTDLIQSVDGKPIRNNDELLACVANHVPGEQLRIEVERSGTQLSLLVKLGDGATLAPMPGAREQAIDSESTLMSKRRWFFSKGIQHDCAISARDCGGPLIDLDGRLLGLNIARAGRIQSYAIPISDVVGFLRLHGFAMEKGELQ